MRFVCFGHIKEEKWNSLSDDSKEDILLRYAEYHKSLQEAGIYLFGIGLKEVANGCKLSANSEVIDEIVLDTGREQIGGFFLIQASNIAEAKLVIAKHPGLQLGSFIIREVDEHLSEHLGLSTITI